MTSKERAALRAKANRLEAIFQIGKGGISAALINQTQDALQIRELIKLKVLLETAPEKPALLAKTLGEKTGADVVQVIGGSIVLYRENPELHEEKKVSQKQPAKKVNIISKPRIKRENKPAAKSGSPSKDKRVTHSVKKDGAKSVQKPMYGRVRTARPVNTNGRAVKSAGGNNRRQSKVK